MRGMTAERKEQMLRLWRDTKLNAQKMLHQWAIFVSLTSFGENSLTKPIAKHARNETFLRRLRYCSSPISQGKNNGHRTNNSPKNLIGEQRMCKKKKCIYFFQNAGNCPAVVPNWRRGCGGAFSGKASPHLFYELLNIRLRLRALQSPASNGEGFGVFYLPTLLF